jgi:hypothetical protein
MNIDIDIQAILRFCLRNLRGCNVGIADGSIYELRIWDGVRCYDIHTKFHKDWFWHSEINWEGDARTATQTQTHTHRLEDDFISLLLFFKTRKVG